jgi:hypothetical protein
MLLQRSWVYIWHEVYQTSTTSVLSGPRQCEGWTGEAQLSYWHAIQSFRCKYDVLQCRYAELDWINTDGIGIPHVSLTEEPTIIVGKLGETGRDGWCLLLARREEGTYAGVISGEGVRAAAPWRGLRKEQGMLARYTERREAVPAATAAAVEGEASPHRSSLGGQRRRGERREAGSALRLALSPKLACPSVSAYSIGLSSSVDWVGPPVPALPSLFLHSSIKY